MVFDLVALTLTLLLLIAGLSLVFKPQTVKDIVGSWTDSNHFLHDASPAQARFVGIIVVVVCAFIAISMLKTVEENRFFNQTAERHAPVMIGESARN